MITYLLHAKLRNGTIINGEIQSKKPIFEVNQTISFLPDLIEIIITIKPTAKDKYDHDKH